MDNYKETKEYFDSKASKWDQIVHHDANKINLILEVTNLKRNSKILDIGSGTGILVDYLEQYMPKQIVEIDLSPEMIKRAESKYDYPNITFLNENFYESDLEGFDYLICYSSYPHFKNKANFCEKIYKALNKDGRFVIAHSQGRRKINQTHESKEVRNVSNILRNAFEEAETYSNLFNVDVIIDTEELYVISGIKQRPLIRLLNKQNK